MKTYRVEIQIRSSHQTVGTLFVRAFTMETAIKKARKRLAQLKLSVGLYIVEEIGDAVIVP